MRRFAFLWHLFAGVALAAAGGLIATAGSPHAKMQLPGLGDARWTGGLWGDRFEVCRRTMLPYMWELFQSDEESHEWTNLQLAAGIKQEGEHEGPTWADGDFFKWFEAMAQMYAVTRDPELDRIMDRVADVIAKAQRDDGYFHTAVVIPQRQGNRQAAEFQDREHFETYNLGHLITAACLHYRATGKPAMLAVARKAGDYLYRLCARTPDELAANAICPSHYMGVIELYRTTGDRRYLELGEKLIAIRDRVHNGTDQNQDRIPLLQQTKAIGHAVRANYLYAGIADLVMENGDETLLNLDRQIADDVVEHKLYITGATGALYDGASPDGGQAGTHQLVNQAYGRDYQLPQLTAYNESCATVGYVLWNQRMLLATGEARYADLLETSLFNGVLATISLEGTHYFYVNPLRRLHAMAWPLRTWRTRQPNIKGCFCCPPNIVRTIAEAQDYAYSLSNRALWLNLYGASALDTKFPGGDRIRVHQDTDYPWDGRIKLTIDDAPAKAFGMKLRIPGWVEAEKVSLLVNGRAVDVKFVAGSYAEINRSWRAGDVVELSLPLHATVWRANSLVEDALNQVAVKFGPIVYCVESADLPPNVRVEELALSLDPSRAQFTTHNETIAGAKLLTLRTQAWRVPQMGDSTGPLYREADREPPQAIDLKLVPYYAWNNRGDCDMTVWLPVR
jgi:uncharacterized protein